MKLPVILISYNNNLIFKKSIDSLIKNTLHPYELIVVDNNSSDIAHRKYLNSLKDKGIIKLYQNKHNQFTFGLNECLKDFEKKNSDLIAICDTDFLYPEPIDGQCWLAAFVEEMRESPYIGKLGLSISLENIRENKDLESICKREEEFGSISLNGNVWAAQVDTTPAVYRKDLFFWGRFRLYPGHMTANKPFYHIGRHKKYIGYHLGWDSSEYSRENFNIDKSKIDSFSLYGGSLDHEVLKKINIFLKIRYYSFKFCSKIFWFSFKVLSMFFFLVKKKFFFTNGLLYR